MGEGDAGGPRLDQDAALDLRGKPDLAKVSVGLRVARGLLPRLS